MAASTHMSAVPNLAVASYYASLEWLRVKINGLTPSDAPFRVLSAHSGSPQYDGEILRMLLSVRPNTEYVVVQATSTYSKLKADEKLGSHVTLVEDALLEAVPHASVTTPERPDGPSSDSVGKQAGEALAPVSFDLVHCPMWRKPFGHNTSAAMDVLMHLTKVGGSLLTFTFAPAGVFNLRDRLAVRLGRQPGELPAPSTEEGAATDLVGERPELRLSLWLHERVGSAWAPPSQLAAGATPPATPHSCIALQDAGIASSKSQLSHAATSADAVWAWRERLASHVDVTALLSEELNATTQRALEDFVETRISAMQAADPEILEDVLLDLVDMSLDGDGIRGNIVVYTPLDATVVRRPAPPAAAAAGLVKDDAAHAAQYKQAMQHALPLLPIDVFALASAVSPNAVECALGLSDYLKLNPDVVSDPHNSLKLCPLRGSWGSFQGTGASTEAALRSVSQTLQVHDAAVAGGKDSSSSSAEEGATAHADSEDIGGSLSGDSVSRSVLARDPWWPQGRRGTFFNAGLQNWYDMRETWTARTTNMQKPPMPPAVDYDQVYDELAVLRRSYTLPGPMRLQDIVELFVEMWAADEQNAGPQAGHASMFSQGMYAQGSYGMR